MGDLNTRVDQIARSGVLLVAMDFDGTLAPIAAEPGLVKPNGQSLAALRRLAALADTHVAIVSGRSLLDLTSYVWPIGTMHLVGSHGSESNLGSAPPPTARASEMMHRAESFIRDLVARTPGALMETKPLGCTFHYRNVGEAAAADCLARLTAAAADWPELSVRQGKKVFEVSARKADKGATLAAIRRHLGVDAMLYAGDDLTDEDVFKTLGPADLGIKVGEGTTAASDRVLSPDDITVVLRHVLQRRKDHVKDPPHHRSNT
jgi:trehalose-phosphatase